MTRQVLDPLNVTSLILPESSGSQAQAKQSSPRNKSIQEKDDSKKRVVAAQVRGRQRALPSTLLDTSMTTSILSVLTSQP